MCIYIFTCILCWYNYIKTTFQVVQNCDELFDREQFSAAPDPGWPDCFNSGVFVFTPSIETYEVI